MEDCEHKDMELRNMTHCNQIKMQCLTCGRSVGNAFRHSSIAPEVLATMQEFDYEFRDLIEERRAEIFKAKVVSRQVQEQLSAAERRSKYEAYLRTPEWRQKRAKVIDRENGLCQGCRERRIEEVHHATYANLGNELLFQLIGLCSPCHRVAHPEHTEE
jgi:hypothetical protein